MIDSTLLQLVGSEHAVPERIHCETIGTRAAAAISVGTYKAVQRKGGNAVANEDAVLVVDRGAEALLAVADGHYGIDASHQWIRRVADAARGAEELAEVLDDLSWGSSTGERDETAVKPPGTTLALALLDRVRGTVRGATIGDSGVFHLAANGFVRRLDKPEDRYVRAPAQASIDEQRVHRFECSVSSGDGLLVCSDGVFECHYNQPATSIGRAEISSLWLRNGLDPEGFSRGLTQAAIRGVGHAPGGQDNITVALALATYNP